MTRLPFETGAEEWDAILTRLLDLHPKKIDLSLGRVTQLLDALGAPQERLPPVDPCRRHEWQGLEHRLHAGDP